MIQKKYLCIVLVQLCVVNLQNVDSEDKPGYGNEWLQYIDDSGVLHDMKFFAMPNDFRALSLGRINCRLYTRKNINEPELLTIPHHDSQIKSNFLNEVNDVKIITHGWFSSGDVIWIENMKNAFLQEYDLNIIVVDWKSLAHNMFYPFSALATRHVGKKVAKLVNGLKQSYGLSSKRIHLIGHSLGAHVMGYAGSFVEDKPVYRITGLDPARPLFEIPKMPDKYILDKEDAFFVDLIHSCGGVFGFSNSAGHADFYPNGGTPVQPGCTGNMIEQDSCSHGRACELFVESIYHTSETGFISQHCRNWKDFQDGRCNDTLSASMGYPVPPTIRGNFYLHTNSESNYAIN